MIYGPTNYTSVAGWNTFNLTNGFDWDGSSNIVIETCFDNAASVGSDSHFYTNTPGRNTTMRYYSNTLGPGCSLSPSFQYAYHPNLRLRVCDPPPSVLTYNWTPPTSLNNPSISNPIASPTTNITYVVSATGGICPAYDTVNIEMCSILPIELYSFNGHNNENVNELYWVTETEINNDYFTVERSMDGINFVSVADVAGAGNSNSLLDYQLTDYNPYTGINYYRLKQTDFNGSFSYSDLIAIEVNKKGELSIYPNPSVDFISISQSENTLLNADIKVFDAQGKIVLDETISSDITSYKLDISNLRGGIYFVKINTQENLYKGTFFKK